MKAITTVLLLIAATLINLMCSAPQKEAFTPKTIYQSNDLQVVQLTENTFVHVSYLQTEDFGKVPCNGLIVKNGNEAIVFDTPSNDTSSATLIKWITESLHCKINAIVPTHFHNDCLGGLALFDKNNIPSYAYFKTIELAKENNYFVPNKSFNDSLVLQVGTEKALVTFFGEGHTKDNVVAYFPSEQVLFGGCLIKELDANKGYLGDANLAAWSGTVEKIKQKYKKVNLVVPGHGAYGNGALLDYTIKLFKTP